jgi:hypothetical protein
MSAVMKRSEQTASLKAFKNRYVFFILVPQQSIITLLFDSNGNVLQADSWPVVIGILDQGSTASDEVKIFAAQTLRSKVSFLRNARFLTALLDQV